MRSWLSNSSPQAGLGHSSYLSPRPFCGDCKEVVPTPGVISESFVVGCLLSCFFCLFAAWGVHLPIVSCLQLLNVVMGRSRLRATISYLRIVLRQSKTDLFRAGVSLFVGAMGDTLYPVTAVLSYLSVRPNRPDPLFMYQDGRPLSRVDLVAAVHQALAADGLDVSRFNGHSFWIGAATTAAQVGVPDSVIQSLGCWKSSAFMIYVRTSPQQLTAISHCLVSS